MKRSIALLVGVVAVLVVAARPGAAAPVAPTTASTTASTTGSSLAGSSASGTGAGSVPADAIDVALSQVAGSGLAVTLDAGASEEHDLVVSNHTANLRLTIKLTATDATGNLGTAAASWLSFGDDAIQLDPHAATTVPMTIAVPHDTQPESALAHVTATVQSAVSAADGSPVAGTASQTFPVSISVRGTPTAQIAIADVHRVDQGSHHQLAIVLRNFGAQGARVSGHVVVASDHPQTLPFSSDLAASRDTTVALDWNAPPVGAPADIAVDLEYGGGNVASWSSRLGGAPTDLSTQSGAPATSATTTPVTTATSNASASDSGPSSPGNPWWKRALVPGVVVLALAAAAFWFVVEMRGSRRRREHVASGAAYYGFPPGWGPGAGDASVELAKQLVRLTEVIVDLTTTGRVERRRDEGEITDERPRARSPDQLPFRPFEGDELRFARAGPAPPEPARPEPAPVAAAPPVPVEPQPEVVRSAFTTPGAAARPEVVARPDADAPAAAPLDPTAHRSALAARVALMKRLMELDEERLRLRAWMDSEDGGEPLRLHLLQPATEDVEPTGEP